MTDRRNDRLRAYVAATQGVAADWDGCSTWPAQWVANETGREFDWPAYQNEEEGRRVVEEAGGLAEVWADVARQAGLTEISIDAPTLGDVGIIETSRWGQVGGIFTAGGGIAVRSLEGVGIVDVVGRTYPFKLGPGVWEPRSVVVRAWAI